jgi:hypothetical protein
MGNRKIVIYILVGCIALSLVLALYFFIRKPDKIVPPVADEEKKVIVFKEVKYSGETKGVIDWETEQRLPENTLTNRSLSLKRTQEQINRKKEK